MVYSVKFCRFQRTYSVENSLDITNEWFRAILFYTKLTVRLSRHLSLAVVLLAPPTISVRRFVYRSFIYPFRVRGKPMPAIGFILAGSFCGWNGFLQLKALTVHSEYPHDYFAKPQFILGECLGYYFSSNIQRTSVQRDNRR